MSRYVLGEICDTMSDGVILVSKSLSIERIQIISRKNYE